MASRHYEHIEEITLKDLIPIDHFRTIDFQTRHKVGLSPTELAVDITVKKKFAQRLSFAVPQQGDIYGIIRMNALMRSVAEKDDVVWVDQVYLEDWDTQFLLAMESEDSKVYRAFYVTQDEVLDLLENGMRIPEQRVGKANH